jgi:hypothetical protein
VAQDENGKPHTWKSILRNGPTVTESSRTQLQEGRHHDLGAGHPTAIAQCPLVHRRSEILTDPMTPIFEAQRVRESVILPTSSVTMCWRGWVVQFRRWRHEQEIMAGHQKKNHVEYPAQSVNEPCCKGGCGWDGVDVSTRVFLDES